MTYQLDDLAEPDSVNVSLAKDEIVSNYSRQSGSIHQSTMKEKRLKGSRSIIPNQAIQLIDFSRGFKVNPQAIDFLNSIKDEIIIVSVVGKARTGKSYLMNLLLDLIGQPGVGFQVASSLQSCTKGIWLWSTPKKSLNGNAKIVFLDSEGTSSTDKSTRTYDSRIFALVVLISSLFLYNTYSNIDEHGISELSLAAHLSEAITTNGEIDKDRLLTELAPNFIWIIRDFTLDKVHPETGEEISSKEYLELCLKSKRCGKNGTDNNIIRQNIIKFFPERDCVTLIRPVDSESDLKRLNSIPFNQLKPEFKIEFKKLKDKIYKEALPKKYNGKKLTGPALATLIMEFVKVINSGKIPNINNTWDSVIEKDISDAYYKSYDLFNRNINKLNIGQNNVYNSGELTRKLYECKYDSINSFNTLLETGGDTFKHQNYHRMYANTKNKLSTQLDEQIKKIINQNNSQSGVYCNNIITNAFHPFEQKLYKNAYSTKDYNDINEDLAEFAKKYQIQAKGPAKDDTGIEFMRNKEKVFVNNIKQLMGKEGDKNIKKMDNNIKLAQADLDDINNMRRVADEKGKIHAGKIKDLENEVNRLKQEAKDLNETLETKKKQLRTIKQRNLQTRKNRDALEALKRNEAEEEGIKSSGRSNNANSSNHTSSNNRKQPKDKNACNCGPGCLIY